MTEPFSIPFSAIVFGSRYRNPKEYGDLKGIITSMERVGLIHPIGLNERSPLNPHEESIAHKGHVYELVDGGRRYKCLEKMGVKTLWHASYGNPERFGFIFAKELTPGQKREIELDENLYRLQCNWIDDVLLTDEIHKIKRAANPRDTWGMEHTAKLLGQGYSKSKISIVVKVAKLLRAKDPDILKAKSLNDAQNILMKRLQNAAHAELKKKTVPGNADSILQNFNIKAKGGETSVPAVVPVQATPTHKPNPESAEPTTIPLSRMFRCQDFLTASFGPMLFNHIVTDIPYGIDMSNLDEKQIASVKAEHKVKDNIELMEPFLRKSYSLIRPGGWLVFCFDLDHWNMLQKLGKSIGFHVQDWPFIACKTSPCRNNAAAYNRTKNFEAIAYFRKDEKSVLRKQGLSSWATYDFASVDTKIYSHPFAKPFALWQDIYDAIAFTGQTVFDPFAGECSASLAAVRCNLIPYGTELVEDHLNKGLHHMKKLYTEVHGKNVCFS